ncbi:VOC family protein [Amycolatopsis sp. cmx-11-12]|uniref:VOC family protein n=1 Tax=Amycolatopsis sp. cmx-11-12 TaxID=2785795 RepID=UPI0039172199
MNIDRIQFLTVPVSDQAKARDFCVGDLDHDARVHLQLTTTTDVDADIGKLRAQGVEVDDAEEMAWGRVTSLKDLDGNGIGLLEPSGYGNWPR